MLGDGDPVLPGATPITHVLRAATVVPLARSPRRRVPTPRDAQPDLLRVAEVQDAPTALLPAGALIYWHEAPAAVQEHIGRICVVETPDRLVLGDLRRGWGADRYLVIAATGEAIEADVRAAWPVEWIKPSAKSD